VIGSSTVAAAAACVITRSREIDTSQRLITEHAGGRAVTCAASPSADNRGTVLLTRSTAFAYPQVISRRLAYSNLVSSQLNAIFGRGSIPGSSTE
jgi:hypothetical protein